MPKNKGAKKGNVKPRRNFRNRKFNPIGYSKSVAGKLAALQKMIGRPEIKQCRYNWSVNIGAYNGTSWIGNAIQPLSPYVSYATITQGTSQSGRIGNKIKQVNSYVCGVITPLPFNSVTNPTPRPIDVLMYLYYSRDTPNTLNSTSLTGFYQTNSGAAAPTGTILDTISPLNRDKYEVVYKRMFKVCTAEVTGSGAQIASQYYTNNDYKYSCRFRVNLTKLLPRVFRFNDNSDTPNNKILHIVFLPVFADGISHTSAISSINVAGNWVINYTDD